MNKNIIDILILIILLCAFFAGMLYGKKEMGESINKYYEEYINESCVCFNTTSRNVPYNLQEFRLDQNTYSRPSYNASVRVGLPLKS